MGHSSIPNEQHTFQLGPDVSNCFNFLFGDLICCHQSTTMPCHFCERDVQFIGTPDPVTPTKRPLNDGAGFDNLDAERSASESNEDEELNPKKKRQLTTILRHSTTCSCKALDYWRES